ncbi:MAG: GAF domain-containing protein, partial [Candidatus Riflebacteria bacterium]
MADGAEEKKSAKERLPDLLGLIGSIAVLAVAFMVYTNKVPKNFWSYFSYFYIFATIGILGILGEKIATSLLMFVLPVLLGVATLAFKFKPQKYPLEDWWEIYSVLVLFSAGFLIYVFFRFEQLKTVGQGQGGGGVIGAAGEDGNLKARVDPKIAAKYREEAQKKQKSKDNAMDSALKGDAASGAESEPGGAGAESDVADAGAGGKPAEDKPEIVESAEERMEREVREIREEFSKRSMRLTTTLMRIKNLAKSLDRDQIFSNIVEIIAKGMDAEKVQLLLNDEKEGKFRIVKAAGAKPKDYKDIEIHHEENSMITFLMRQKMNEVTGGVGALGVKECEMDPKTKGLVGQGTLKSVICAPIYAEGKLFAVINVETMRNPDYTRDDQNLLATCADIAGLVMKNAKLYSATMDDLVSAQKLSEDQLKKNEELKGSLSRIVSPSVA